MKIFTHPCIIFRSSTHNTEDETNKIFIKLLVYNFPSTEKNSHDFYQ